MSRTTETVTSPITSTDRSRSLRPPPDRAPSRNAFISPLPDARHAGSTPKTIPVTTVSNPAKINTRTSTAGVDAIGSVLGTNLVNKGTAFTATNIPRQPPSAASTMLSVMD